MHNAILLKTLIAQAKTIRECGIDVYNILKIAEQPHSQEIQMKAASMLWDREEGKPNQSQTIKHDGEIEYTQLKFKDSNGEVKLK